MIDISRVSCCGPITDRAEGMGVLEGGERGRGSASMLQVWTRMYPTSAWGPSPVCVLCLLWTASV